MLRNWSFFLSESEKIIFLYFHSPAGWDSVKKINILSEHLKNIQADDAFDDHIVKPQLRKVLLEKWFTLWRRTVLHLSFLVSNVVNLRYGQEGYEIVGWL